jgi:peroxiredoxin
MIRVHSLALASAFVCAVAQPASAAEGAELGKPAPAFTLKDVGGKSVSLSDFKGKRVVLEWFNPGCPFVKHAHGKGPLKDQARKAMDKGVVWLAINSGAPGKQGAGKEVNAQSQKDWAMPNPILLDEAGDVGRRYGAKTTPHMFVIDEKGVLVYRGGIDNAPLGEAEGPVVNHVDAALGDLAAGRKVARPEAKPYGCSVKYGS